MYERFTDRARKVMQLANQEAIRLNHEYVGTEAILVGLMKEGSGVAANVLKNLDIQIPQVRLEIEKCVQPGPDQLPEGTTKLPQTPRAKKVIEYAIDEARRLGHNYIGTEHLLLGLLREGESVAVQVLTNLGVKAEDVRDEILNLLGHNPAIEEKPVQPSAKAVTWKLQFQQHEQLPGDMVAVRLETANGELVSEEVIPPFLTPPEVVIWGQRFFKLHVAGVYREAFTYFIVSRE